MAALSLPTALVVPVPAAAASIGPVPRRGDAGGRGTGVVGPALLVVVLLLGATVIAPEAPEDQAAICQRHHGPAACRVW